MTENILNLYFINSIIIANCLKKVASVMKRLEALEKQMVFCDFFKQ